MVRTPRLQSDIDAEHFTNVLAGHLHHIRETSHHVDGSLRSVHIKRLRHKRYVDGPNWCATHSSLTVPVKGSKMPPVNVAATVTESLGVNRSLD